MWHRLSRDAVVSFFILIKIIIFRNPNAHSIEAELFKAMCADGIVSEENAVDPKKIGWARACRTDKGVHAIGQVVSAKILIKNSTPSDVKIETHVVDAGNSTFQDDLDTHDKISNERPKNPIMCSNSDQNSDEKALDDTVQRLNKLLPKDIRIFGIKRAVGSFQAKERCDSRVYEYLLPTYALAPASRDKYSIEIKEDNFKDESDDLEVSGKRIKTLESDEESSADESKDNNNTVKMEITDEEKALIKSYRIDVERLAKTKSLFKMYEGTHHFHNFTLGKLSSDPSSKRNIISVNVGDTFIRENLEWIAVRFHGQSFMLHQIRKMVGLVIQAVRLNCKEDLIVASMDKNARFNVPKAPALGLMLDYAVFGAYNRNLQGNLQRIDFEGDYALERQALKDEMIYPRMVNEEVETHQFMGYLKCIDEHGKEILYMSRFFI